MKKIILGLIIALSSLTSFSQEINFDETKSHEFGAHLGFTTGMGLSYRHWTEKIGIQATLLPIKTDHETFISIGLTGMYSMKNTKYIRAYLYLGNHFIMIDNSDPTYNIGIGPGFSFGKTIAFNLMLGYGAYDITGELNLLPTGEIGLYYKF